MRREEIEIIQHLRNGKKANISEIARTLRQPISTISDRIKRIEDKYILKRSSILNLKSTGYLSNSFLIIKCLEDNKTPLLNYLNTQNSVNSVFHTNTGSDFLIEVICKNEFDMIDWIRKTKSDFNLEVQHLPVLKTEHREKFQPEV
ncbi:hypothetical protein H6503_03065 [Candidatus Woesearchaeota archaeon]|nr:hypothetical protein [Candidatus Woesearchaeota archaeon]